MENRAKRFGLGFEEALERWNARQNERGVLVYSSGFQGFDADGESKKFIQERERRKMDRRMFGILKLEYVEDKPWDEDDVVAEQTELHEERDHHDYVEERRGGPMYWWAPWLQCLGSATIGTVGLVVFGFLVFAAVSLLNAILGGVQQIVNNNSR
jgi:hypothetical protein